MVNRPPSYRIIRKGFADGREEYTVRVGRFGWLREYCMSTAALDWTGDNPPKKFSSRALAEKAVLSHWNWYLSTLPAIITEEEFLDPLKLQGDSDAR